MNFLVFTVVLIMNCIIFQVESSSEDDDYPQATVRQVPGESLRITNGIYAKRGQFPFMAGVFGTKAYGCGGSLINKNWVLTAARCLQGHINWTIHLGSIYPFKREAGDMSLFTTEAYIHPKFHWVRTSYVNQPVHNVGLVRLPHSVSFTEYIKPIPLESDISENIVGTKATIAGWGTQGLFTLAPESLLFAEIKIWPTSYCEKYYKMNSSNFCGLGENKQSIYVTDWGGPVTSYKDGEYVLVGIAGSFVPRPVSEFPALHIRVAYYKDWIDEMIG